MAEYKAPLRDIRFCRNEMFNFAELYERCPDCAEATPDVLDAILEELGKFCEQEVAPLYQIGDQQGCVLQEDGEVKTPDGFKEAYKKYVEGGWPSLSAETEYGGQGLPHSLGVLANELNGQANWSWSMYPGLSHGALHTLHDHGTEDQKQTYLTKLVEGSWTGTMCLTESHCGTDLGMLRTKAEPQEDGSYKITGTKIFISSGEHDMADNIVHIVIARLPGAPEGTKGISLFIVPKYLPDADGNVGERNAVSCGALEHKMGIHGNATAVINLDGATGFLVGEENKGLNYMFTFMNTARIGTGLQGLAHHERAFQGAIEYARERLQMRSLTGPKNPDGPADPIIVHPDVRRMLLTCKAFAEGSRMLAHYCAYQVDVSGHSPDEEERKAADDLLAFLTPIVKAFITETGFESANLGMQVYGGHGYIAEWGMEQNVRDSRISMMYEGTTGIQAIDLLGRKVLGSGGELLKNFTKIVYKYCKENEGNEQMKPYIEKLSALNNQWGELTMEIGGKAMENADEAGSASVDYLMYSGYVCLAYFWARAAQLSQEKLAEGTSEEAFYKAKILTADFYYQKLLPRTTSLVETIRNGADSLMAMDEADFTLNY